MTPQQRFKYLNWLRDITQRIDIGYVFVFYYGLERQIIEGNVEKAVKMIKLLKKHHHNNSFQDYSNAGLMFAATKDENIDYLNGISLDKFNKYSLLNLKYQLFNSLTIEDIIQSSKIIGFTNQRYIKNNTNLFKEKLSELLIEKFDDTKYIFNIPEDYSFSVTTTVSLANYSLSLDTRSQYTINILSHSKTKDELYSLLFTAHESVKITLRERRKQIRKSKKN